MGKGYLLTIYMNENCDHFMEKLKSKHKWIAGKEQCPSTGRWHYQCYYETEGRNNPKEQFKQFKGVHIQKAEGSTEHNVMYCSKDGDYEMKGFKVKDDYSKEKFQIEELLPWQKEVVELLKKQTTRQILWVVDKKGNKGKSTMAMYLYQNCAFPVILSNAKTRDILYGCSSDTRTVIFDFSRSVNADTLNYDVIEQLKNGFYFCSKYESKSVVLKRHPAIIVFANFEPNQSKMTKDRWVVFDINKFMFN